MPNFLAGRVITRSAPASAGVCSCYAVFGSLLAGDSSTRLLLLWESYRAFQNERVSASEQRKDPGAAGTAHGVDGSVRSSMSWPRVRYASSGNGNGHIVW